jgi:hypothetical protein
LSDLDASFEATSGTFQLDAVVAAAAERFRGSPWGDGYVLADVNRVAGDISENLPATDQAHDFLRLLEDAARLER